MGRGVEAQEFVAARDLRGTTKLRPREKSPAMTAKNLAQFPRRQPTEASSQPTPGRSGHGPLAAAPALPDSDALATQFLRSFHVLLRSVRLYHQHHPRLIESLKSTGQALDEDFSETSVLALVLENGSAIVTGELT